MLSLFEALLREHQGLLALAEQKKDILVKGDMEALNLLTRDEVGYIHRIERLEKERLEAVRLLAMRAGVSVDEVKPDTLLRFAENEEEAQRIRALVEELRDTLDRLKKLNDLNKQLIEQSLLFVQTTIELLTESPHVPTYGPSHSPYDHGGRTSFFDSKA
jgi:flagellar biosynthesis/type III secretory pathway chaperone